MRERGRERGFEILIFFDDKKLSDGFFSRRRKNLGNEMINHSMKLFFEAQKNIFDVMSTARIDGSQKLCPAQKCQGFASLIFTKLNEIPQFSESVC